MSAKLKATAKQQRDNPTDAESSLWELLRRGQVDGHKFRRKHVFRNFIVDFACLERHVVIEIETDEKKRGSTEGKKKDQWLESRKYIVLYFKEVEVNRDPNGLIPVIKRALKGLPPVEKEASTKKKTDEGSKSPKTEAQKTKTTAKASKPKEQKVESVANEKKAAVKKTEKVSEPKATAKKEEKAVKPKTESKTKPESGAKEVSAPKSVAPRKGAPKPVVETTKKTESIKEPAPEPAQKTQETKIDPSITAPENKIEPASIKEKEPTPVAAEVKPQSSSATDTEKLWEKLQARDSLSGLTVGDVDFSGKEFKDKADFSGVIFSGAANFSEAIFLAGADFSDSQFTGSTGPNFCKVSFLGSGKVNFIDTFFSKESLVDFSSIKAETPENIRFENVFLGRASFLNTEVSRFQFRNIQLCQLPLKDEDWFDFFSFLKKNIIGIKTWSEFKVQVKNFIPIALSPEPVKRIGLVDEVWNDLAKNGQTRLMDSGYYRQVSELYKQFRKNFQRNKDYSLTVDLRYGEYQASQK